MFVSLFEREKKRENVLICFSLFYLQIFDSIIPCAIMTPLDCFWEGSKLLGPEYPVHIP